MDRKTMGLLVTEALLIVVLVVVIAMDFNKTPSEKLAASHDTAAVELAADAGHEAEAPAEEVKHEEPAEAAEEAEEAPVEEAAAAAPAEGGGDGTVADVIAMNNPSYEHKKGIVQFTHKKHADEYKLNCGECHHDDSGEPLKDLKMGDEVTGCIECHSKPGKAPKPQKGEKMSPEEKREYHVNALHDNCIDCHKDYNKKNKTKAAPATCGKCHPKPGTKPAVAPAPQKAKKPAKKAEAKPEEKPVAKAEKKAEPAKKAEKKAEAKKEEKPAAKAEAPKAAGGSGAVADVIAMNNASYEHKKGIVQFTHKKHTDEYKLTCGECHHDDSGEPLKDLKMGDEVTGCIECHSKPGKAPKPKKGEKMSSEEKREFHVNALHDNCIDCHKDYNKKNKTKAAPATCGKCHPKNK